MASHGLPGSTSCLIPGRHLRALRAVGGMGRALDLPMEIFLENRATGIGESDGNGLANSWAGIWVFPKIGGTPKWMMKIMENPMNKWMMWGYPYFWKHPFVKRNREKKHVHNHLWPISTVETFRNSRIETSCDIFV